MAPKQQKMTQATPLKRLWSHFLSQQSPDWKEMVSDMEQALNYARRRLEGGDLGDAFDDEPAPKKTKPTIVDQTGSFSSVTNNPVYVRDTTHDQRWPCTKIDFDNMSVETQNNILMMLVDRVDINTKSNDRQVVWRNGVRAIKKHFGIGQSRLDKIKSSIRESVIPSIGKLETCISVMLPHGNKGRTPHNALSDAFPLHLQSFISTIETEPLPFNFIAKVKDALVLPLGTSWVSLHTQFLNFLEENEVEETCAYSTFCKLIKKHCPEVYVNVKQEDVCDACYYARTVLKGKSQENYSREENQLKSDFLQHQVEYLKRRDIYSHDINLSRYGCSPSTKMWNEIEAQSKGKLFLSIDMMGLVHSSLMRVYSFDYKQTLPLPYDGIQPANFFYHSKRNIQIFGVVKEHREKNMNTLYVYDECSGKKSANEIITMLMDAMGDDEVLPHHHLVFYADNCPGQNKNKYMVAFLMILVLLRRCASIRLKFLVVGHTHNSCDRLFGQLSKKYEKRSLSHIDDVVVVASSMSNVTCKQVKEFRDFKTEFDQTCNSIDGIKCASELCITQADPTHVYFTEKSLSVSSLPELSKYEKKVPVLRQGVSAVHLLQMWGNAKLCPMYPLSKTKIKHLQDYYKRGLVRKELFDYYFHNCESEWGRGTRVN